MRKLVTLLMALAMLAMMLSIPALPATVNPYENNDARTLAWCAGITVESGFVTHIHDGNWLAVVISEKTALLVLPHVLLPVQAARLRYIWTV